MTVLKPKTVFKHTKSLSKYRVYISNNIPYTDVTISDMVPKTLDPPPPLRETAIGTKVDHGGLACQPGAYHRSLTRRPGPPWIWDRGTTPACRFLVSFNCSSSCTAVMSSSKTPYSTENRRKTSCAYLSCHA